MLLLHKRQGISTEDAESVDSLVRRILNKPDLSEEVDFHEYNAEYTKRQLERIDGQEEVVGYDEHLIV